MIFRKPQKKVEIPVLHIGGGNIECVNNFNFLGIVLNHHLNWHSHTTKIANKICKIIGILNKLKHILPQQILSTIYTSLLVVTPHLNFGILLLGDEATRIYKLQKKAIRTISKSKYNAHTEPIFKKLKFLKLNHIFKLQQLKFYYKLIKGDLPKYFQHFSYIHNFEIHHHYTRETTSIFIPRVNHAYAQKHIRHNLIQTINNTPNNIIDKIHTHSLRGFLNYIKVFILVTTKITVMFQIVIYMGHFHKKGQITVKTWRSFFNPVATRYLCISIDICIPCVMCYTKIINAYHLYYY